MATEAQLRDYLRRAAVDLTESRRRVQDLEDARHEPVAVVGMSCRFPGAATSPDAYWELLRDGRSGVLEVPPTRWNVDDYYDPDRSTPGAVYTRDGALLEDISGWDAQFFGTSPNEALRMDPQQRLLMELMWEGLEDAGIAPSSLAGSRTGVLIGLMDTQQYGRLECEAYGASVAGDPYFGQGVTASVMAGRLAYQYDLRGPAVTIDTACSSSLVGVHLAIQSLRRGECDLAVAGGVYLVITPDTYVQACATSQLSADGRCKTFDASADGYVLGEGAGLVMLERLSTARRNGHRVRALLRGSAVNQDGRSNGLTAPNRGAQVAVIRQAMTDARVEPGQVGYVEAHGSGTALGDAIELAALHDVFGSRAADAALRVGAVKTNVGHTQSAAGVAGLIKSVLALEHGELPGNLNFANPAPALPDDGTIRPVVEPTPFPGDGPALAGVSGFGWSGTNAHVVVEASPVGSVDSAPEPAGTVIAYALPVSAASEPALRMQLARLGTWVEQNDDLDIADLAHTLGTGRAQLDVRRSVLCTGRDDAARQLTAAAAGGGVRATPRPRVAFLLPGVGDEYTGLGRELYDAEPVYAAAVDECLAVLDERCGVDLRPYLFPTDVTPTPEAGADLAALLGRTAPREDDPLHRAEIAHPFLFTVEYALAALLRHRGVRPDVMIGYSLGEYVAACLAGVFTLPDALHVVVERARLTAGSASGRMLAAVAGEPAIRTAIAACDADVDIAALNGPSMTVVSGTADGVHALAVQLGAEGIACKQLLTTNAFHSSLLEPVRDKLAAVLETVERRPPTIAVLSNRTGRPLTAAEATSSDYWADHLITAVHFEQGVRYCVEQGVDAFVELGAGQTLGGLLHRDLAADTGVTVVGTLPARLGSDGRLGERARLLASCERLWELGVAINWAATMPRPGRVVSAPTYPFQRTRFWPERTADASPPPVLAAATEPGELGYAPSWRRDVVVATSPALTLPGPLVIYADGDGGVGTALATLAETGGTTVVRVIAGSDYADDGTLVRLDPARPEHHRQLFSRFADDDGAVNVAYLWGLRDTGDVDGALGAAITDGYATLLSAVQACGDRPGGVRLVTVSRGATEVLGGDVPAPHTAAPHGLGRVARHEYPELSWHGVDLDPDATDPRIAAAQLAHELVAPAGPEVVGWRRGRRWLPEWTLLPTGSRRDEAVWRPDGVYLITGGTRGLGRTLAHRLVALGVRRLALVSRSATRADVSDLDADVLLLDADTAAPDQFRAALRRCREHFGALHGIVHAAGVPASGMVRRQTVEDATAVIAPKIMPLGPLAEMVASPEPPELVVLYSSAITAFGAIGEADYCAANTVLDAYGQWLSARGTTRVVSVAWGPWQHDAWQSGGTAGAASELALRAGAYRAQWGFPDDVGCAFLDDVVRSGHGSVVAVRQPMADAEREWSRMLDMDALVSASAVPKSARFPRPDLRSEYVAPRTELETTVAEAWGSFLGIDRVGAHDPFFDLGGNSLVGLAMLNALGHELGITIAPALLFEHPTVAELATALDRLGSAGDDTDAAGAGLIHASADRGQRRRRARTDRRGTRA